MLHNISVKRMKTGRKVVGQGGGHLSLIEMNKKEYNIIKN